MFKHREFIHTECDTEDFETLLVKAVKLDGNKGLRDASECCELKSCDYLKYKKDKVIFIEISDLQKQKEHMDRKIKNLENLSLKSSNKKFFKNIVKLQSILPNDIIKDEMREKYMQSLLLLYKLSSEKTMSIDTSKQKYFTIALCNPKAEDTIIFQPLKRDIKQSLKNLVDNVDILSIDKLEEHLKSL